MKTLAATVPGKTERMARRFLRDGLLSALTTGRDGIGWEIHSTYADMLWFAPHDEARRRWSDFPPPDQFLRDFPEECEYCESSEEVEATVAGRKRICATLLAEALNLIDSVRHAALATTGEFLFQIAEYSLPVRVTYRPDGEIERLEMHFAATREQRESAHQVTQWRLENPAPCAPGCAEDPAPQPPPQLSLIRRMRDFIIPILIWSFAAIISLATALTCPLSSLFAFAWGFTAIPFYFLRLDRYPFSGDESAARLFWKFAIGFFALLFLPAIICGIALWTLDAIGFVLTTAIGMACFVVAVLIFRRDQREPEIEPL